MRMVAFACVLVLAAGTNAGTTIQADGPCRFEKTTERQYGVRCHGIAYDLTIPEQCLNGTKCGVIIDVHGACMNGTWEEALTEMSTYARPMDCLTLQPTAKAGCTPPACSWGESTDCAEKMHPALDDLEAQFDIDSSRLYMGGSSEGGFCTNAQMSSERAGRFAAFVVGAAWADIPPKKHNFTWVIPQLEKFKEAWDLTEHSMVSVGKEHEHHRWTDAAKSVTVEWLVHNYTLKGETISGIVTAGHCAPGGHDDEKDTAPFARIAELPLRLSCPQPNPKSAERGSWAGLVTSTFYSEH